MYQGVTDLIGFAAGSGVTSLSHVADGTSATGTIALPTLLAGDIIVLYQWAANSDSVPPAATPANFTNLVNEVDTSNFLRIMIDWKIAVSGDSGGTITGMNGLADKKIISVFRPDNFSHAPVAACISQQLTSGDPTAQTVTASGGTAPLVVIGAYYSNGEITTREFTPSEDAEIEYGTVYYLKYKIYNSSPANVSVDMADYGAINFIGSFYISDG